MSGWRNLTIDVGDRRKGVRNVVRLLRDSFSASVGALESAEQRPDDLVDNPSSPLTSNLIAFGDTVVALTLAGYGRIPASNDPTALLPDCLAEHTMYWKRLTATAANDTTDSGRTVLFETVGSDAVTVDIVEGEEAAAMVDVVEYFEEEYSFSPMIRVVGWENEPRALYATM